jgi:general secretion pathway protein D
VLRKFAAFDRPNVSGWLRLGTVLALAFLLIDCSTKEASRETAPGAAAAAPAVVEPGPVPPPQPVPAANLAPPEQPRPGIRRGVPQTVEGTGTFVAPRPAPVSTVKPTAEGEITFNFVGADVREVIREILGNQLHLNYVIDSKVQGTITAQTGAPVPRDAVLPTLEAVLRANGLAIIETEGIYRVLPVEDASKASAAAETARGQAGFAVRVLPLHYISAAEIKGILEPFLPPGAVLQVDAARNLLIVTGAAGDLEGVADLVRQFDVDWLAGTSFGLYPLHVGLAKEVATELDGIFGDAGTGPLAGLIRILPIERLNAILVISPQRAYLAQVKAWITRLDYGDDQTTPRLFEYHVQNSRAADLAAVLAQLFSSGQVSTVGVQTAPGTKQTELGGGQGLGGQGGLGGAGSPLGGGPGGLGAGGFGTGGGLGGLPGGGLPGAGGGPGGIATPMPGGGATGILGGTTGGQPGAAGYQGAAARGQPGSAEELKKALQPGLGGAPGAEQLPLPPVRIVADEKNNALVIYARPRDYKMIEDAIRRLDVVPLQVLIEATVVEVTLNNDLQYGIQYFLQTHGGHNALEFSSPIASANVGGVADITASIPGFNYIFTAGGSKVVLNALSNLSKVTVVSAPEVLVLDHQTAALQVGDQVPILAQQASTPTLTSTTGGVPSIINSVEYVNTGVILQVTPRVNTSGLISLDVDQSVSAVEPVSSGSSSIQSQSPTISQRRIVTSAVVQDGETIALGGLILHNQTNSKGGVPLLSTIPVIGNLFSDTTNNNDRTELLVLLTPKIVRNAVDARAMTQQLRDEMNAIKPLGTRPTQAFPAVEIRPKQ